MYMLYTLVCVLIIFVCLLNRHTVSEHFTTTPTNETVLREITDIQEFVYQFGYGPTGQPLVCKKNATYDTPYPTSQRSEKVDIHSDWTAAAPHIRECFSKLVPILEDMRCDTKLS